MTTINEISNHIMSYFDGTLDAFGYTAQSVNEISNPDESYMGTLNHDRAILTKSSGRHSKHLPEPPYL